MARISGRGLIPRYERKLCECIKRVKQPSGAVFMEMHQVRYFLALCEELNFARAAGRCGVSQPSLTRAIKKLEVELGGPLFYRDSGGRRVAPARSATTSRPSRSIPIPSRAAATARAARFTNNAGPSPRNPTMPVLLRSTIDSSTLLRCSL